MNRDIPMSYVAFDIETTGLNPKVDKIIEIGAVRIRDGRWRRPFRALSIRLEACQSGL